MNRYIEPFLGGGAVALGLMGAEPFLRWAGGKRKLRPEIEKRLHRVGCSSQGLVEVGSATSRCGCDAFADYSLSDGNLHLVQLFKEVRDTPEKLLASLDDLRRDLAAYAAIRAEEGRVYGARTLYLNAFGFNGLWRVNRKGGFNTPPDPKRLAGLDLAGICRAVRLASGAMQLQGENAVFFHHHDFRTALASASRGDVAYLDPPYVPDDGVGSASKFVGYGGGFDAEDHHDVAVNAATAAQRGCRVVVSNSLAARPLYEDAAAKYGVDLDVAEVTARTSVGAKSGRGERRELLMTMSPRGWSET